MARHHKYRTYRLSREGALEAARRESEALAAAAAKSQSASAAAEQQAEAEAEAEAIYVRSLMELMGFEQSAPTPVYVDNQAAETVAKDPVMNNGMKHVNRRHYFAKEAQLDGEVKFEWVDTKGNLADALTKALALPQFQALTGQMRKLTVMGGKALSAMRAALARAASD